MSVIEQIQEFLQLAGIKATLENLTKPVTDLICSQLAAMGIEAEVTFDISVKSVNLDTFKEQGKKL